VLEIGRAIPEFPFVVLTARKDFVRDESQRAAGFIRALDRSVRLIREDKTKAVGLARAYGLRGDLETQRKYIEYIADSFQLRLAKENINALLKVLKIDQAPEMFFNDSLLKKALGS
jgi:ABC-type nitrate/sulfonate/bicarbonate transport system substrate-binding protein